MFDEIYTHIMTLMVTLQEDIIESYVIMMYFVYSYFYSCLFCNSDDCPNYRGGGGVMLIATCCVSKGESVSMSKFGLF